MREGIFERFLRCKYRWAGRHGLSSRGAYIIERYQYTRARDPVQALGSTVREQREPGSERPWTCFEEPQYFRFIPKYMARRLPEARTGYSSARRYDQVSLSCACRLWEIMVVHRIRVPSISADLRSSTPDSVNAA